MAVLLSLNHRKAIFKELGLGAYNKTNILAFQKKWLYRKSDWDGIYGQNTDNALRTVYYTKKYTKNFNAKEFRCECGGRYCCGFPSYMKPAELIHIQKIRDHYGKPITITCGLRDKTYNSMLGGSVQNSLHLKGQALDFYQSGVTDTLANRKKAISWIKKQSNHHYTYGNGINSSGYSVLAPYMGNALHTDTYNNVKPIHPKWVEPKKTTTKTTTTKTTTKELYRVRASWNEPATQVGAYADLENAKESADVNHLNVYASNGKLVYSGKKKETIADKVIKACKDQIATMKKTKYGWRRGPTVENTKEEASCVSYGSVVYQRVGALKSGECIWHNGSGYGTGKVYIWDKNNKRRSITEEDPIDLTYMGNKSITSLKSKLKIGDMVLLDDNKSGDKGSGGHEFILAGWDGNDPLVWDMEPNRKCIKTQKPRVYDGDRKVLAIVRLK